MGLVTQSEQERSCILLARLQRRAGDWLWLHCVLQVKESPESSQQPVIVCTNQVLSDHEAAVMRTNGWLYHYYSVQSKLQYGLTYDTAASARVLYYPEPTHGPEFASAQDNSGYAHLATLPPTLQPHQPLHATHMPQTQHGHHYQHRRLVQPTVLVNSEWFREVWSFQGWIFAWKFEDVFMADRLWPE